MKLEALIERLIPHDKALHLVAGASIFGVAHLVSWQIGIATAIAAGIIKEVLDHFTGGDVSVWDVIATVGGACIGLLCYIRF